MENLSEQPETTGENREENGRFTQGISGNPSGRPKGSISIRDKVRQELEKIPDGEKETYLELMVKQILTKALKGDFSMLRLVWEQLDGRARESMKIDDGPLPTPILVSFLRPDGEKTSSSIYGGKSSNGEL